MQQRLARSVRLILISGLVLNGCATSKDKLLPQEGPTMLEIYEGHLDRAGQAGTRPTGAGEAGCQEDEGCATVPAALTTDLNPTRGELAARAADRQYFELVGYTRQIVNEIQVLFPTLPNPTLVMYVYPHLAGEEQMPVPGYATSFSMYARTEYALPGEVSQPWVGPTNEGRQRVQTQLPRLRAVAAPDTRRR